MIIEILFAIALILLVSEALIPAMGILGFAGFIAYISGVWMLIDSGVGGFYGISITNIIILGIVFFLSFGILIYYLYRNRHKKVETGVEYLIGQTASVTSWNKGKGKVFIDGEDWRAKGPENLKAADIVVVSAYNKMTLIVEKA